MTDAAFLDVCAALLALLGSLGDGLTSFREFVQDRLDPIGERYKTYEEKKLERFWGDYYRAQSRYYADLAKIDWVSYYKNHGTQINAGDGGRIQLVPEVVVPRLESAVSPPRLPARPSVAPKPAVQQTPFSAFPHAMKYPALPPALRELEPLTPEEDPKGEGFWREYYEALRRYYGVLDRIDWVGYYKKHGMQIDNGPSGRIRFHPEAVVPVLKSSDSPLRASARSSAASQSAAQETPLPPFPDVRLPSKEQSRPVAWKQPTTPEEVERFARDYYEAVRRYFNMDDDGKPRMGMPGNQMAQTSTGYQRALPNSALAGTPDGPQLKPMPGAPPLKREMTPGERFWNEQIRMNEELAFTFSQKSQVRGENTAAPVTIDMKLVEADGTAPPKDLHAWSKITVRKDGTFSEAQAVQLTLATGSAQDLIAAKSAAPSADRVPVGTTVQGKIAPISPGRVRLDLTLEKNEVENAGKNQVLIAGRTYRLAQQVQVGERTKVVLQSDRSGAAQMWLEFKVNEAGGVLPELPVSLRKVERPEFKPQRTQVRFSNPALMKVSWMTQADLKPSFATSPVEAPGRYNFMQGAIYRLKLRDIPDRRGVELYPTLEVVPATAKTSEFLAHNYVPVGFSDDDFKRVIEGQYLVKVVYLVDPLYLDGADPVVDEIVSTRLEPGQDPIQEAQRRGSILLVIRIGNVDCEVPWSPSLDAKASTNRLSK